MQGGAERSQVRAEGDVLAVDAVGHVVQGTLLGESEGDGEKPRVGSVGEMHEARLAEHLRAGGGSVEEMQDVVLRTRPVVHPAILGDDEVRVVADATGSILKTGLDSGHCDRIEGNRKPTASEPDSAVSEIDVRDLQVAELMRAGAVQETEQTGHPFVRIDVGSAPSL